MNKPIPPNESVLDKPEDQIDKSIRETVSKAAEWFLVVVGLIYSCGFLIVFTFFKSFGINTIEFVEAKYIHIGSLFLMACATIILPMRWLFIGIDRWYHDDKRKNEAWVKRNVRRALRNGDLMRVVWKAFKQPHILKKHPRLYLAFLARQPVAQVAYRVVNRFFCSDWQVSDRHGMHANFPALGSATLMMWCFLLLLTFQDLISHNLILN